MLFSPASAEVPVWEMALPADDAVPELVIAPEVDDEMLPLMNKTPFANQAVMSRPVRYDPPPVLAAISGETIGRRPLA